MLIMAIVSLLICATGCYLAFKSGAKHNSWRANLVWIFILTLVTFGTGQASYGVAYNIAQDSAVNGYHQFLNGTVVSATVQSIQCTEDGSCRYTYDCDAYTVIVPVTTTDSKGNSVTTYVTETHYHSCPYVTVEYEYQTTDSLGTVHDFGHFAEAEPKPWRPSERISSYVLRGVPADWQRAHEALAAGHGIPVTADGEYANYILASSDDLLRSYSDKINLLQEKQLLPEHTRNLKNPIHNTYDADKVSFVGVAPPDTNSWEQSVMQFNAALGMELRGDLHIVILKNSDLPSSVSPEDYLNAVKAYWLNGLDKYAIAKNAIIVVLGISDDLKEVEWAKSATGMPIGNGPMLQQINASLTNAPFAVSNIMGSTVATVTNGNVTYDVGHGLIPQTVMVDFPFKRACMKCSDKDETASDGFINLPTDAPVAVWGYFVIGLILLVISGAGWLWYISASAKAQDDARREAYYRERYTSSRPRYRDPWDDDYLYRHYR